MILLLFYFTEFCFVSLDFETVSHVSQTGFEFVHPRFFTSEVLGSQVSATRYDLCGAAHHIQYLKPRAILPVLLIFKISIQTYRFHQGIFTNVGHYILFIFIHFSPNPSLLPDGFLLSVLFSLHIYPIMFSAIWLIVFEASIPWSIVSINK